MTAPTKAFASQADLEDKKITFEQLSPHCWAYTAEGDPNSGVIIGEKAIMVADATATPAMAQDLIARIRTISDKPIKYVLLTHYHAVRVLGASAYLAEGATEIIASQGTYELIVERGAQDMQSEMERFPRLFRNADEVIRRDFFAVLRFPTDQCLGPDGLSCPQFDDGLIRQVKFLCSQRRSDHRRHRHATPRHEDEQGSAQQANENARRHQQPHQIVTYPRELRPRHRCHRSDVLARRLLSDDDIAIVSRMRCGIAGEIQPFVIYLAAFEEHLVSGSV